MNEGHGAFAALERIALLVRQAGLTFDEARLLRAARRPSFTTHTPVPAGHDRFDEDLLRRYLSDAPTWLGIPWERFLGLGSVPSEPRVFNMTSLAVRLAGLVNGVSERHAEVSRPLLRPQAPFLLTPEVPVNGITNGVHLATWTAPEVARLLGAADGAPRGQPVRVAPPPSTSARSTKRAVRSSSACSSACARSSSASSARAATRPGSRADAGGPDAQGAAGSASRAASRPTSAPTSC